MILRGKEVHVVLVSLLLTLNIFTPFYSVCIVDFEQVNVCCERHQRMSTEQRLCSPYRYL